MPRKPKGKARPGAGRAKAATGFSAGLSESNLRALEGFAEDLSAEAGVDVMSKVMALLAVDGGAAASAAALADKGSAGRTRAASQTDGTLPARAGVRRPRVPSASDTQQPGRHSPLGDPASPEARAAASLDSVQDMARAATALVLSKQMGAWWRPAEESFATPGGRWLGPGTLSGRAVLDVPDAGRFGFEEDEGSDPVGRLAHRPVAAGLAGGRKRTLDQAEAGAGGACADELACLCGSWALLATAEEVALKRRRARRRGRAEQAGPAAGEVAAGGAGAEPSEPGGEASAPDLAPWDGVRSRWWLRRRLFRATALAVGMDGLPSLSPDGAEAAVGSALVGGEEEGDDVALDRVGAELLRLAGVHEEAEAAEAEAGAEAESAAGDDDDEKEEEEGDGAGGARRRGDPMAIAAAAQLRRWCEAAVLGEEGACEEAGGSPDRRLPPSVGAELRLMALLRERLARDPGSADGDASSFFFTDTAAWLRGPVALRVRRHLLGPLDEAARLLLDQAWPLRGGPGDRPDGVRGLFASNEEWGADGARPPLGPAAADVTAAVVPGGASGEDGARHAACQAIAALTRFRVLMASTVRAREEGDAAGMTAAAAAAGAAGPSDDDADPRPHRDAHTSLSLSALSVAAGRELVGAPITAIARCAVLGPGAPAPTFGDPAVPALLLLELMLSSLGSRQKEGDARERRLVADPADVAMAVAAGTAVAGVTPLPDKRADRGAGAGDDASLAQEAASDLLRRVQVSPRPDGPPAPLMRRSRGAYRLVGAAPPAVTGWVRDSEARTTGETGAAALALQAESLRLLVNLTGDGQKPRPGRRASKGRAAAAPADSTAGTAAALGTGLVPVLLALLASPRLEVVERAAWCLGNLAGAGVEARDAVLSARVGGVLCCLVEMVCSSVAAWLERFDSLHRLIAQEADGEGSEDEADEEGGRARPGGEAAAPRDGEASRHDDRIRSAIAALAAASPDADADADADAPDAAPSPPPPSDVSPAIVDRAPGLLRVLAWTLARLCDGHPRPKLSPSSTIPAVARLLRLHDAERAPFRPAATHATWALSFLCDGSVPDIRLVLRTGLLPVLVRILDPDPGAWRICKPALRALGNVVCAEDDRDFTDEVVTSGAVPRLTALVGHPNREIEKEACWTLSNVAAGTESQIQEVLDSARLPDIVRVAMDPGTDPGVRTEASWVVLNATSCGADAQVAPLVHAGCVRVLCWLLGDSSMGSMASDGLDKVLRVCEHLMEASDRFREDEAAKRGGEEGDHDGGGALAEAPSSSSGVAWTGAAAASHLRAALAGVGVARSALDPLRPDMLPGVSSVIAAAVRSPSAFDGGAADSHGVGAALFRAAREAAAEAQRAGGASGRGAPTGPGGPDDMPPAQRRFFTMASAVAAAEARTLVERCQADFASALGLDTATIEDDGAAAGAAVAAGGTSAAPGRVKGRRTAGRTAPPPSTDAAALLGADGAADSGARPEVAMKKAERLWCDHFVGCSMCRRSHARTSPRVFFCEECRCMVCKDCRCWRFHLAAQQDLIRSLEAAGELDGEGAAGGGGDSKRSKAAKRRERARRRREAEEDKKRGRQREAEEERRARDAVRRGEEAAEAAREAAEVKEEAAKAAREAREEAAKAAREAKEEAAAEQRRASAAAAEAKRRAEEQRRSHRPPAQAPSPRRAAAAAPPARVPAVRLPGPSSRAQHGRSVSDAGRTPAWGRAAVRPAATARPPSPAGAPAPLPDVDIGAGSFDVGSLLGDGGSTPPVSLPLTGLVAGAGIVLGGLGSGSGGASADDGFGLTAPAVASHHGAPMTLGLGGASPWDVTPAPAPVPSGPGRDSFAAATAVPAAGSAGRASLFGAAGRSLSLPASAHSAASAYGGHGGRRLSPAGLGLTAHDAAAAPAAVFVLGSAGPHDASGLADDDDDDADAALGLVPGHDGGLSMSPLAAPRERAVRPAAAAVSSPIALPAFATAATDAAYGRGERPMRTAEQTASQVALSLLD